MDVNQALVAQRLKRPVIASWPTSGGVEYECILSVHSCMPEFNIHTPSAVLKSSCGHSVTVVDLKKLRLKERNKDV